MGCLHFRQDVYICFISVNVQVVTALVLSGTFIMGAAQHEDPNFICSKSNSTSMFLGRVERLIL